MEICLRTSKLKQTLNQRTNKSPFQIRIKCSLKSPPFGLAFLDINPQSSCCSVTRGGTQKAARPSRRQLLGATIWSLAGNEVLGSHTESEMLCFHLLTVGIQILSCTQERDTVLTSVQNRKLSSNAAGKMLPSSERGNNGFLSKSQFFFPITCDLPLCRREECSRQVRPSWLSLQSRIRAAPDPWTPGVPLKVIVTLTCDRL